MVMAGGSDDAFGRTFSFTGTGADVRGELDAGDRFATSDVLGVDVGSANVTVTDEDDVALVLTVRDVAGGKTLGWDDADPVLAVAVAAVLAATPNSSAITTIDRKRRLSRQPRKECESLRGLPVIRRFLFDPAPSLIITPKFTADAD